jgi:hypothetical protein
MQTNKDSLPRDSRRCRIRRHLRKWASRNRQTVHDQILRGVSYGIGSGAVSLLVLWYETRR